MKIKIIFRQIRIAFFVRHLNIASVLVQGIADDFCFRGGIDQLNYQYL
jgi:hypothetical protein